MTISWSSARLAIRSWIVGGASPDIAADHVVWSGQQRAIPSGMWVAMRLLAVEDLGGLDWQALTETSGVVTEHLMGHREVMLETTVFGGVTQTDATLPAIVAERIRSRYRLVSVQDALCAVNVSVLDVGAISTPGAGINSSAFEPRAIFMARLSFVSETTGVIPVFETVGPITQF